MSVLFHADSSSFPSVSLLCCYHWIWRRHKLLKLLCVIILCWSFCTAEFILLILFSLLLSPAVIRLLLMTHIVRVKGWICRVWRVLDCWPLTCRVVESYSYSWKVCKLRAEESKKAIVLSYNLPDRKTFHHQLRPQWQYLMGQAHWSIWTETLVVITNVARHRQTQTDRRTCTHTHARTYTRTYIYTHTHADIHARRCACIHVHTHNGGKSVTFWKNTSWSGLFTLYPSSGFIWQHMYTMYTCIAHICVHNHPCLLC